MKKPVALFIKKVDGGHNLIIKTLDDATEHSMYDHPITQVTKAFELFDYLVSKVKINPKYDIQYISEDIL